MKPPRLVDIETTVRELERMSGSATELGDKVMAAWGFGPEHRFAVFARAHGKMGPLAEYILAQTYSPDSAAGAKE